MNRRDFGSMIVGMPLLDLEGRVNAYEVAGKAASLGARLDRLRLCADFVNAAFHQSGYGFESRYVVSIWRSGYGF